MMNVLLTSVGRRSYLVEYFRSTLAGTGRVIAANMYADAAGMFAADVAVLTPPSYSDEYVPALLEVCRRYEVGLLCSLHDLDVYMLSQHAECFVQAGTTPVLPSAEWGRIALDKFESTRVLQEQGIPVPWTTLSLDAALNAIHEEAVSLPLIVKARTGFGSLGMAVCRSREELVHAYWRARDEIANAGLHRFLSLDETESVLIQQQVRGREVSVGVVNDLGGTYRCHFVCEIHSMRAGESDFATTLDPQVAGDFPRKLSALTRHPGIWGIDCMDDAGILRVIDINPRFTGDYPFNHLAGADIPKALISWAKGDTPHPRCFSVELGVKGFKDLVPARAIRR